MINFKPILLFHTLRLLGRQEYVSALSKEVLYVVLDPRAAKLQAVKVGFEKKYETFWVRGYIFASLYSESLLFGRPRFDPRTLQTLKAYNFAAP